ncbi:hypothetical protein F7725_001270, partial [Dissostichus mawsoni]
PWPGCFEGCPAWGRARGGGSRRGSWRGGGDADDGGREVRIPAVQLHVAHLGVQTGAAEERKRNTKDMRVQLLHAAPAHGHGGVGEPHGGAAAGAARAAAGRVVLRPLLAGEGRAATRLKAHRLRHAQLAVVHLVADLLRPHLVRPLVLVVDPAEVGHDDGDGQSDHQHAAERADGAEDLPGDEGGGDGGEGGALGALLGVEHDSGEDDDGHGERKQQEA